MPNTRLCWEFLYLFLGEEMWKGRVTRRMGADLFLKVCAPFCAPVFSHVPYFFNLEEDYKLLVLS